MIAFRCQEAVACGEECLEAKGSLWARLQLGAHLRFCVDCRRYVAQLTKTVVAVRKLGEEPVPFAGRDALLARLKARGGTGSK